MIQKALIGLALVLCMAADAVAVKFSPETSKHFEKRVDPESGMVGYVLKTRLGFNQQSFYFTQKSMTDDGRFLCFEVANEDRQFVKRMAMVDFEKDEVFFVDGVVRRTDAEMAYLDVQNDELWYLDGTAFYKRELLKDPQKPVLVCRVPEELTARGPIARMFTHLTLNAAKTKAFFDVRYVDDLMVQGVMDFTTGRFTRWSECLGVCINHASIHPFDDTLGLCAQEVSYTDKRGVYHPIANIADGVYPRLQLVRPGQREVIEPVTGGGATHETWAEDGRGFLYCSCGVNYHDLKTGRQELLTSLYAAHCTMTTDNRYLVFDRQANENDWYRGCPWNVIFWNRETGKWVYVYKNSPALNAKGAAHPLHPDPHPTFGGKDRYVVCSINDSERRLNLFAAPVAPLIAATSGPRNGRPFKSAMARRFPMPVKVAVDDTGRNMADFTVYEPKQPKDEKKTDPTKLGDRYNDHFQVLPDPQRKCLYAFWTQATAEGKPDQHVSFSKSTDGGVNWSPVKVLAGSPTQTSGKRIASWQQPMLSKSGRLYCLWNQQVDKRGSPYGRCFGAYSDDGGETWSAPEEVKLQRADLDGADPSVPPRWICWQRPLRLGKDGRYFAACSHYGQAPYDSCPWNYKTEFWEYENIDDNPDVKDIRISVFAANRENLYVDKLDAEGEKVFTKDTAAVEEASVVKLPDGRLFALMRTSTGYPLWSQSRDEGRTWSRLKILRNRNGKPFLQPRSPCPIYDFKGGAAASGKYFCLLHNTFDFNGVRAYQTRGPVYFVGGEFDPDGDQPIRFSEPRLFWSRPASNAFYSSYTVEGNVGTIWFGDMKHMLVGKIIDESWFKPAVPEIRSPEGIRPALPGFHPDPSICRAGDWYYLVTSSMTLFPGLPIYRSRDLRTWEQIGDVLSDPEWRGILKLHDFRGQWAPTLRYRDGLFHLVGTERFGRENFYISAKDPAGPWSEPVWLEGQGIDPCVFWDDDGRTYLMAVCDSHDRSKWIPGQVEIYLHEIDLKTGKLIGKRFYLTTGAFKDSVVAEGPHLYKIDGTYYLMIAEGGSHAKHCATVFTSSKVTGPYEPCAHNPALFVGKRPDYPICGAGHADLVQAPDGNWYGAFLATRTGSILGRETFVCPVELKADGLYFHPETSLAGTMAELPGYRYECSLPGVRVKRVLDMKFQEVLTVSSAQDGVGAGLIVYREKCHYYLLAKEKGRLELLKANGPENLNQRIVAREPWRDDCVDLRVVSDGKSLQFEYAAPGSSNWKKIGEVQDLNTVAHGLNYGGLMIGRMSGRRF